MEGGGGGGGMMMGLGEDGGCGGGGLMNMVNSSPSGGSIRRAFQLPNFNLSQQRISMSAAANTNSIVGELFNSTFMETNNNNTPPSDHNNGSNNTQSMKAKIMAHPHFPRLLNAYANCQKVGAPPEVVARLEQACGYGAAAMGGGGGGGSSSSRAGGGIGEDPGLDQFMEAYCEMLSKYEQELTKPFKEAMVFLSRIEYQFKALTVSSSDTSGRNGSSEEEMDGKETYIDPQAEDSELKGQLLRRYSGYLGNLKQEFLKKKKKGKLPKEARQQLLDWWSRHYKWPYPSESQKLALAESTGLDQKQINNWFINQRKRHWKPSEDMQFVVMDAAYPHYYLENVVGKPYPMEFTPTHI